jgi:bifunctional DNA-binding transcriptional regulator/antitoxin component of YhaV-PrlF toxin-antitoxin module
MTMTTAHQVPVPKKVLNALGIQPGDSLKWVVTTAGALLVKSGAKASRRSIVSKLRGKGNGRYTTAALLKLTRG